MFTVNLRNQSDLAIFLDLNSPIIKTSDCKIYPNKPPDKWLRTRIVDEKVNRIKLKKLRNDALLSKQTSQIHIISFGQEVKCNYI